MTRHATRTAFVLAAALAVLALVAGPTAAAGTGIKTRVGNPGFPGEENATPTT